MAYGYNYNTISPGLKRKIKICELVLILANNNNIDDYNNYIIIQ